MKCAIITACAVGIAHTYMAAEAMERAAKKLDIDVSIETQGSVGIEDQLKPEYIEEADMVILATDVRIQKPERLDGKIVYQAIPADAIKDAKAVYDKAFAFYESKKGSAS